MTTDQGQPSRTPSDLHVQASRHAAVTTARALAVVGMTFPGLSLALNVAGHVAAYVTA